MLSKVAIAYYASAGDDEISESRPPQRLALRGRTGWSKEVRCRPDWTGSDTRIAKNQNAEAYQKIHFRPRILRKVAVADAKTTILGKDSKIPVFISPAYVSVPLCSSR